MKPYKNFSLENIIAEIKGIVYTETWKPIKGCRFYEISSFGRVKSLRKNIILKSSKHSNGYRQISVGSKKLNEDKKEYVHRLGGIAFVPNPDNKPEINHDDGDKANNFYLNLLWATESENMKHSYEKLKRINPKPSAGIKGIFSVHSRTVNQVDIKTGKIIKVWGSISEAATFVKCKPCSITDVLSGRWPTCKGYKWTYSEVSLNAFKPRDAVKYEKRKMKQKEKSNI